MKVTLLYLQTKVYPHLGSKTNDLESMCNILNSLSIDTYVQQKQRLHIPLAEAYELGFRGIYVGKNKAEGEILHCLIPFGING
jgi:hypothetical protein